MSARISFVWLAAALSVCSCSGGQPRVERGLEIGVASLELEGIDYACYDVVVTGPSGLVVSLGDPAVAWTGGDTDTICS